MWHFQLPFLRTSAYAYRILYYYCTCISTHPSGTHFWTVRWTCPGIRFIRNDTRPPHVSITLWIPVTTERIRPVNQPLVVPSRSIAYICKTPQFAVKLRHRKPAPKTITVALSLSGRHFDGAIVFGGNDSLSAGSGRIFKSGGFGEFVKWFLRSLVGCKKCFRSFLTHAILAMVKGLLCRTGVLNSAHCRSNMRFK